MSFYESYDMKGPSGVRSESKLDLAKLAQDGARNQIKEMLRHLDLTPEFVKIISPYVAVLSNSYSHKFTIKHSSSGGMSYTTHLAPAFVINNVEVFDDLFDKLNTIGKLELIDILSLQYDIYAFNDTERHVKRLSKSVQKFNDANDDSFALEMKLKTLDNTIKFNIIVARASYRNSSGSRRDIIEHIKFNIFPLVDSYFNKDPKTVNEVIIKEFISKCREAVRNG